MGVHEMPKGKRTLAEPSAAEQNQSYDTVLKSLFEGQEQQMLAHFLAGVEYLETLNIEALRTPLRVDRVYKVRKRRKVCILNLEYQVSGKKDDADRLLEYHSYFRRKYRCSVISIMVYPFQTTAAVSPLREGLEDEKILEFHFHVIKLWEWDAERYLREHAVPLYALLPTMAGANAQLLHKAIDEMVEYYQNNEITLAKEVRWLGVMLRRAKVMSPSDKQQIERRLNMFDDLMERDPKMRKIRAESEARGVAKGEAKGKKIGLAEGEAKGETKGLQEAVVTVVEGRFPPLAELARGKVARINTVETLTILLKSLAAAPNEDSAQLLLELLIA